MIDTALISVSSGKGGDGSFSYRREKFAPKGGPDGGDGGHGGDVYFVVNPHKNTLRDFQSTKEFAATDGQPGGKRHKHGLNGEDLVIEVPAGTIVWEVADPQDTSNKEVLVEMVEPGKKALISLGGNGGRGNSHFKNSTNRTPLEYEEGGPAQEKTLLLELKLLADIGFVGFPNAGKSTLLSVLTHAVPKIADYPFTTLSPNLGVMEVTWDRVPVRAVLADIPGLVEEASAGKGLGHQFLRHIERCRVLLYVLAPETVSVLNGVYEGVDGAERLASEIAGQWETLRQELSAYNAELAKRPFLVGVNKLDILSNDMQTAIARQVEQATGQAPVMFSAATSVGLDELRNHLVTTLQRHPVPAAEPEFGTEFGPHLKRPKAVLVRRDRV